MQLAVPHRNNCFELFGFDVILDEGVCCVGVGGCPFPGLRVSVLMRAGITVPYCEGVLVSLA